jgi:transposase-like protein
MVRGECTAGPGGVGGAAVAMPAPEAASDGARSAKTVRLLALLEPERQEVTTCSGCAGTRFGRWGTTRRGLQRWRCRACGRTCTAATGTAFAHLHSLDKLRLVAADMLAESPRSCRALALALDLDRMTVWRWRRLIADAWADLAAAGLVVACGSDTVVLRESRKASREWVRHRQDPTRYPAPGRLRWIDYRQLGLPLPEPMSRYRVRVPLGSGSGRSSAPALDPWPLPADAAMRRAPGGAPPRAVAATPEDTPAPGAGQKAPTTPLAGRFQRFLAPFTGPATRHLITYRAWFEAWRATVA